MDETNQVELDGLEISPGTVTLGESIAGGDTAGETAAWETDFQMAANPCTL